MDTKYYDKIAVVGLGALFPDAHNIDDFWSNIISKKVSIKKLPEDLFESEIYYRPELRASFSKQNKSYTNIAGYIENIDYNTVRKFKIPPSVAEHMDPNQHAALYTADQAIKEITLDNLNRERISVIFGNGSVGTRYGDAIVGVQFDKIKHYLKKHPLFMNYSENEQQELFEYLRENAVKESIPITEDSAPGVLPNIIAARVSNVFDLHGPSYTIDSACASALTSVIAGIKSLRLNESDAVVCGGSDMPIKSLGLIFFSAINALSPDGSFPFDERANGFVMGQGSGTVILKRLEDAIENHDKIYAIINGYGEASDGKGKYIAAPNPDWQAYSIEKACLMAGYPVDTIELIEAHGTGTTVGDVVELEGLNKAFSKLGYTRTNYCGVSSVKSNIGHLKSAAGIAGLIKGILALHHKKLPPTASLKNINPKLKLENSPFYILDDLKDWKENPNHPRRANVSAFGFGGADYHLALEEYREGDYSSKNFSIASYEKNQYEDNAKEKITQSAKDDKNSVLYLSADSEEELLSQLTNFTSSFTEQSQIDHAEFIKLHNLNADSTKKYRISLIFEYFKDIEDKVEFFIKNRDNLSEEVLRTKGIYHKFSEPVKSHEVALLFPGQASQYVNMFTYLRNTNEAFRIVFDKADAFWMKKFSHTVSSLIYGDDEQSRELENNLKETQNTHPSIFTSSLALYNYLKSNGLKAKFMIGHSLGEITALAAAGKIEFPDALRLVCERGNAFKEADLDDKGKMISVAKNYQECNDLIEKSNIEGISIANINSNKQTIVAGSSKGVDQFKIYLDDNKISNKILFVSHAFHTSLMKPVSDLFGERIKDINFLASDIDVMMNHTGEYYTNSPDELLKINQNLADQILEPVNYVRSIEKLFDNGVKLFIEIGPNSVLSSLTKNILKDKGVSIITSNFKNSDEIQSLQKLNASLFAEGIHINPTISKGENIVVAKETVSNIPSINSVVYSGVSIGLPGSYKSMFQDDNFEQVFEGRNFIERLTDEEKQRMVDLRISKLVKNENGPAFKLLSSLEDVIQLAGKIGKIDMLRDYHIDENELKKMTKTISIGIAAAYEALKDAHIPLIQEYTKTGSGRLLPGKLSLPKYMQRETGVIFANGFPMVDPIIDEVSKHISYYYGSKTSNEIVSLYESIISKVKDSETKKLLTDWFTLSYSRLNQNVSENGIYNFNYNFMTQISSQANNRIANLINAKGPNFQLNAACSSTSNAITIGEDFIRSGRVKRMIIVGADDSTSSTNLPFLGAGFLSTGAATNESDLYKAAVPFDIKRNGMIMSSGAVGIVLEEKEEVRKRGVIEICELLGSHSFNTANHPAQIDSDGFSSELIRFIEQMEKRHNLDRTKLAKETLYLSHETYTPPRGGCSQTEAAALTNTFNSNAKDIIIGNTKGMTGHAMGAALEEAIAAKALQFGKIPPVVNLSHKDPLLSDLNISEGGLHKRKYALRMSAGFGAQGHYLLLKKSADGDSRITDHSLFQKWLNEITNSSNARTEINGRIMTVTSDGISESNIYESEQITKIDTDVLKASRNTQSNEIDLKITEKEIINKLSELTSYPPEMLESDMEFHADLGVEEKQQNEISENLNTSFCQNKKVVSIGSDTTIGEIISAIINQSENKKNNLGSSSSTSTINIATGQSEEINREVIKIFSEVTKYPEDMLELDMEMEADLGIDTVKQATILSMIGEKYHMERDEDMRLSDYPTIGHIINYVNNSVGTQSDSNTTISQTADEVNHEIENDENPPSNLVEDVISVFSEVTKYPEDMLELDMEMEADLGIDTVKQATILSILGEKYLLDQNEDFKLSDYPTIGHIVELIKTRGELLNGNTVDNDLIKGDEDTQDSTTDTYDENTPAVTELSRQIPILVNEKLEDKNYDLSGKKILLIGNNDGTNLNIFNYLSSIKGEVFSYTFPKLFNPEELVENFNKLEAVERYDVIIDSTFLSDISAINDARFENIDDELFYKIKNRFLLYKYLQSNEKFPEKILCLISMDGSHGINSEEGSKIDPLYGAISGFYKSLRKEFEKVEIKVIDYSPNMLTNNYESLKETITNELEYSSSGIEIAYNNGDRKTVVLEDKESSPEDMLDFTSEDTFLVTGGASGITFKITEALAKKYPSKFIIVGRTSFPSNIDELVNYGEVELSELRKQLHSELEQHHTKVTPKMVNDKYDRIAHAIEIYRNIGVLDSNRVKYISCDITDYDSLWKQLEIVQQKLGSVTVLIHGAGIDKSQYISKKNLHDFNQVFDVKVKGALNLQRILTNNKLQTVAVLSSISGRFGNAAQTDYSSANNFLNTWVTSLKNNNGGINAFSFATSGWQDYGMAWRNEFVRKGSLEMGLNLIEPYLAVQSFIHELEKIGNDSEIIIHKGLNGFIEPGLSVSKIEEYPLLDRVISKNGEITRAYRILSPSRDAFMDQHRLGETPIMPAVGYSEIGAEFFSLQTQKHSQFLFNKITFENPFKLFSGKEKEIFIEGSAADNYNVWELEIKSNFKPKNSSITNTILHSSIKISSELGNYDDMIPSQWDLEKENPMKLPASESLMLIEGEGPKQRIILGPLYNDIVRDTEDKASVTLFNNSVIYPTRFPQEQFTNIKYPLKKMLVNPCFLDTIYQSCAAHLLVTRKRVYLPWYAQDLGIVDVPKEEGIYTCYAQLIEDSDDIVKYRVTMLDENDNIRYFVRKIEFRKINL